MPQVLLGVDGGSSKARALLATLDGEVVGTGLTTGVNYQAVGLRAAVAAIEKAVHKAFQSAALRPEDCPIVVGCFGLAGVGRPADRRRWEVRLRRQRLAQRVIIVSDAELVLAAGCPAGWGIALIAGTGSICVGRTPDGRELRVGGWGYLLGDEGSGFALALQALRLAVRAADGRAAADPILRAALEFWGLREPNDLIELVYRRYRTAPSAIASFARRVVELAEHGESIALALLEHAADELAQHIVTVAARLGLDNPPLAFAGGLLVNSRLLRESVCRRIGRAPETVQVVDDPALGALRLAQRATGADA